MHFISQYNSYLEDYYFHKHNKKVDSMANIDINKNQVSFKIYCDDIKIETLIFDLDNIEKSNIDVVNKFYELYTKWIRTTRITEILN
jgi:hypothetical protein